MRNKLLKYKKITLTLGILFIVLGLSFTVVETFYRPTSLNKLVASKLYSEPANTAFTDQNFYNCVISYYNFKNGTTHPYTYNLSDDELKTITSLTCSGQSKTDDEKISDLSGIEKLTSLTSLNVSYNKLTSLDVSKNIELTNLNFYYNEVSELDISKNVKLQHLYAFSNKLTEIDVSKNVKLIDLELRQNELTSLDLSNCVELVNLYADYNDITEIDVSKNVLLERLWIHDNDLTGLDVTKNTALISLDVGTNKLTEIDVTKNTALVSLHTYDNDLTELDISKNLLLEILSSESNKLTSLDTSKNTALTYLNVAENNLAELDVSNNTKLESLYIKDNNFKNKEYAYKLENIDVNNYSNPVTLFTGKNITFSSITANSDINVSGNEFNVKNAGNYDIIVNYTHDINTLYNSFTVTYNVISVELLSNSYYIDNENDKIYIGHNDTFNINNLNISAGGYTLTEDDDITLEYSNNKVMVKHGEDVLKEFTVEKVSLSSSTYNINNNLDYIYIGLPEVELASISSNIGDLNISNSKKLEVKVGELVLDSYDLIMITSNRYNIFNDYIFIGNETFNSNNLSVSNATYNLNNNKIEIIKDSNVLHTLDLLSINFGNLTVRNKYITMNEVMSYEDFISEISSTDVTYKIYNDDTEVTSGDIEFGMTLEVYKDSTLVDTYNISEEYYDLGSLEVDKANNYVTDLKDKTKVSDFVDEIETNGSISVVDKNNNSKDNNDLIVTGDKVKITLEDESVEYTLVVKGDVDGDGESGTGDAYSIILHVLGKKELTGPYKEAGIVDDDEDEPTTGDAYSIILYVLGKKDNL